MADLPKVGIDIGATNVKMVELAPAGGNKWKLLSAGSIGLPSGGMLTSASNMVATSQAIAKMLKEAGVRSKKVVVSLPEEQISSHVVEMPLMSDDEVRQALQWQVEQYIPIPADKAVWSHEVIKKDTVGGGMEVLLVAAAKTLVNSYTQVLEQAGLEVEAMETELMATARADVPPNYPLSLVVDVGSKGTDVGVVRNGQLVFSRTIPTAGDAFTRAIETTLGLDAAQAEQYKNTYGFTAAKLEGKLAAAMRPVLAVVAAEIKKTVDFYSSKHIGELIKVVILSGGGAAIPELAANLSGSVGIEVAMGNPFERVSMDQNQTKTLASAAMFYAVAVGLAMRSI